MPLLTLRFWKKSDCLETEGHRKGHRSKPPEAGPALPQGMCCVRKKFSFTLLMTVEQNMLHIINIHCTLARASLVSADMKCFGILSLVKSTI